MCPFSFIRSELYKKIILLWCFGRWRRLLLRGRLPRERGRTRPPRLQSPVKTSALTADTANTRSAVFVVPDYNNNNKKIGRKRRRKQNIKLAVEYEAKPPNFDRLIPAPIQKNPFGCNLALWEQYIVFERLLLLQPIRNAFLARFSVHLGPQYGIFQSVISE